MSGWVKEWPCPSVRPSISRSHFCVFRTFSDIPLWGLISNTVNTLTMVLVWPHYSLVTLCWIPVSWPLICGAISTHWQAKPLVWLRWNLIFQLFIGFLISFLTIFHLIQLLTPNPLWFKLGGDHASIDAFSTSFCTGATWFEFDLDLDISISCIFWYNKFKTYIGYTFRKWNDRSWIIKTRIFWLLLRTIYMHFPIFL